jgi:hypothetical protein
MSGPKGIVARKPVKGRPMVRRGGHDLPVDQGHAISVDVQIRRIRIDRKVRGMNTLRQQECDVPLWR